MVLGPIRRATKPNVAIGFQYRGLLGAASTWFQNGKHMLEYATPKVHLSRGLTLAHPLFINF